jgi:glycosyl transferase family 1
MVWNWMHLVGGLRDLGHDVFFVEEVRPEWFVDGAGHRAAPEDSINRRSFVSIVRRFELEGRACQVVRSEGRPLDMSAQELERVAKSADLLINISGHVVSDLILGNVGRRLYFDQDPVYTQLWHAEYRKEFGLARHDVFLTVGLNIGTEHSHIPDGGMEWRHTLPPVVLDWWPVQSPARGTFTTIASVTGYRDLCYRGEWYRSKLDQFRSLATLPKTAGREMEVALKRLPSRDAVARMLRAGGWSVADQRKVGTLDSYRRYIASSRAEVGITKDAYVRGRSGWFSDRSAMYLASGRPVLAQSTGCERLLPTDCGFVTFNDLEDAADNVERIDRDYAQHSRAARAFAEEHLDHRRVLAAMLEACA